jgi:hypothetical protein
MAQQHPSNSKTLEELSSNISQTFTECRKIRETARSRSLYHNGYEAKMKFIEADICNKEVANMLTMYDQAYRELYSSGTEKRPHLSGK